jgi:transcriptional regulator of heat shock response
LMKKGKVVDKVVGAKKEELEKLIEKHQNWVSKLTHGQGCVENHQRNKNKEKLFIILLSTFTCLCDLDWNIFFLNDFDVQSVFV